MFSLPLESLLIKATKEKKQEETLVIMWSKLDLLK